MNEEASEGRERLGKTAMDLLDDPVGKYGDELRIGQVVVIAEVDTDDYNGVEINSSDPRAWTVHGLCSVAASSQLDRLEGTTE